LRGFDSRRLHFTFPPAGFGLGLAVAADRQDDVPGLLLRLDVAACTEGFASSAPPGTSGSTMVQHALDRGYEVVGECREQSVGTLGGCSQLVRRPLVSSSAAVKAERVRGAAR
jgi:hypothetical protein